jgi:hypothetical protein
VRLVLVMGHDYLEVCSMHSQCLWNFHMLVFRNINVPGFQEAFVPDYGLDSFESGL